MGCMHSQSWEPSQSCGPNEFEQYGAGRFSEPSDVAVCPRTNRVVVADTGNHKVQVLSAEFSHIMDITQDSCRNALKGPWAVAVNSRGDIIVSDYIAQRVLIYNRNGDYINELSKDWSTPRGIAVDGDDIVYVCEEGSGRVSVWNHVSNAIRSFAQSYPKPRHLIIWRDDVIVSDDRGRLHQFAKSRGSGKQLDFGKIKHAVGLTVHQSGDDLVIVSKDGSIHLFDGFKMEKLSKRSPLRRPGGVAVAKTGEIIVANTGHHNLIVYNVKTW